MPQGVGYKPGEGKPSKGKYHKMPDGTMMKGAKHSKEGAGKKPPVGTGERFSMLVSQMQKRGMDEGRAKAVAAAIGRKKYGKAKFQKMAATGRKKKMSESAYGDMYIPKHR
jgi:hypothetical protein